MCVVELKAHRHRDGRRSEREKVRFCHEGKRRWSLCDHVERHNTGSAPVSEPMAPSSSRPISAADFITTGRDGKERQYFRIGSHGTKRSLAEGSSVSQRQSLDVSLGPSSLTTREVRPSSSRGDRHHRHSTQYAYSMASDQAGDVDLDGDAYERPPSLEMLEGGDNSIRQAQARDVSPTRRYAQRQTRPKAMIVDNGGSMTDSTSSLGRMSPGLSNLPRLDRLTQDPTHGLPFRGSMDKYHARVDSLADEDDLDYRSLPDESEDDKRRRELHEAAEHYQAEQVSRDIDARDFEQARLARERMAEAERRQVDREQAQFERRRLAESDRRQFDREARAREEEQTRLESERRAEIDRRQRVRRSQEAETQARVRAEAAQREYHRQETAAALERSAEEAEYQRRVKAEFAQMARERSTVNTGMYAAPVVPQYYEPRSMPPPPVRITYTNVPASSSSTPISARQMTNTYTTNPPTTSARPPSTRQPAVVYNNYTSAPMPPRDFVREHGENVIAREQQNAAAAAARSRSRRLSTSMRGLGTQDRELDAAIDAGMRRRQPNEGWERERVRRYERQQEYYQS